VVSNGLSAVSFAMIRAPERTPDEIIAEFRDTIVARLNPRRVILIGSRARGDARPDSDYDIVVEFDAPPDEVRELGNAVYNLPRPRGGGWELNVIARRTGDIERSANDPGTLDWDIVRQGRVLYSASGDYVLNVPARQVHERPPESLEDWIRRAGEDLQAAKLLATNGGLWDQVAFHAQQSGEKYLKALLVSRFVRPMRTHELSDLRKALQAIGIPLETIEEDCLILTPFGVESRYGPARASEPTARAALRAAERIRDAVLPLLP
jgi:HEPN domain-containing protein/predicted nucleotidyltransferase